MSLLLRVWLVLAFALPILLTWALIIALVSRFRWKISQWCLPMLAGPAFVLMMLIAEYSTSNPLQFRVSREIFEQLFMAPGMGSTTLTNLIVGLIAVHVIATVLLSYWGLWRYQEGAPAARKWSLRDLFRGLSLSIGLLTITFVAQNWVLSQYAYATATGISSKSREWLPGPPADQAEPQNGNQAGILAVLEESAKSTNPAFEVDYSPYQPLKTSPVRKEIELGNKIARVHFEALEGLLRTAPFRPASQDLLTWDRQELVGFRKLLKAARLAVIIAIEEADHERIVRYLNILALCSDQLRAIPDADCLVISLAYASARSALMERWLAEAPPTEAHLKLIVPLQEPDFASRREAMLRNLESTILHEHAQFLAGKRLWSGDPDRIWLVENASSRRKYPLLYWSRVINGADNLLLAPAMFEKYRIQFLGAPAEFDNFGSPEWHKVWNAQAVLVSESFPTFGRLCEGLLQADARESLTQVALQVARFQMRTKAYPASLADLVPDYLPENPVDPFVNRPLHYLREGEIGAVVYSVNLDRRDQQPDDPSFRGDKNEADIVFCLGDAYRQRRVPKPPENERR